MQTLDQSVLSDRIHDFITAGSDAALFAGAGVSARAGLPTWRQLMDHLASIAEKYDPTEGEVIRKRAASGYLLNAAQAYKSCPSIPIGEKYREIALPFENPAHPERLNALISLPFSAVFTTNYDRSLHHAYAAVVGRAAKCVELQDPTMDRAPFDLGFYIARIHGRAEVPESMVLDENDYARAQTPSYHDFVVNCLSRYRCLFLGFSFLDPAIKHVLDVLEQRLGPTFPSLHMAVIPADSHSAFINELTRFNIRLACYDAGLDHSLLWNAIDDVSRRFTIQQKKEKPIASIPFAPARRFLAAAYARSKMATELLPLRDIVVDGIVLDLLNTFSPTSATIAAIAGRLHASLPLPFSDCEAIAASRVKYLAGHGLCRLEGADVRAMSGIKDELAPDMRLLSEGAANRLLVRYSVDADTKTIAILSECIEATLIVRGWDLGASFLGSDSADYVDLRSTLASFLADRASHIPADKRQALALACVDLFANPDETESAVLARLGRIAFALHLVTSAPSTTYTHDILLPQRIYLDSNILMPAIVDGHPMRPVYVDALRRLTEASEEAGRTIPILVLPGFLNEIIAHRDLAIREVHELGLEGPEELRHHLLYYGASRANVFVAAYGSWVGRRETRVGFHEFLNSTAPYSDQRALAKHLKRAGIALHSPTTTPEFSSSLRTIGAALRDAYETDPRWRFDPKEPVLIENEARQLTCLQLDQVAGITSAFVSGDLWLQKCCTGPVLAPPRASVLSSRQFVQLVDMLLGMHTDPVSMARLLWAVPPTDEHSLILNYFTDLALQHYSRAEAQSLPHILSDFVPQVLAAAKDEGIPLFPAGTLHSKSIQAKFLDRFEDRFYEQMADAIRKTGDY